MLGQKGCTVESCQKMDEAARRAVKHVFEILGVDVDNPKQVEDFRRGLRFGEDMVQYTAKGKMAVLFVVIGIIVTAAWKVIATVAWKVGVAVLKISAGMGD